MGKAHATRNTGKIRSSLVLVCTLLLSAALSGLAGAAVTSPLMHNSANLGTKYGTWGTTYGCSTCHNQTTTNIKRVATTVTTPTGARSVTFDRITSSTVTQMGVMGNDQRTTLTSSTNICEVCHHQTTYHQYSSSKAAVTKTHNNRADCTVCHDHAKGFAAIGCNTCHPSNGGLVTTTATNATGGVAGAHAKHTGAPYNMVCVTCHNGYTSNPMGNAKIEMGYQVNQANFAQFNPAASVAFGTISAKSPLTGYTWVGAAGTTVAVSANTNTSCNIYCHGNWANSRSTADPNWTGGALACNSCHFDKSNAPAGAGDHQIHLGLTGTLNLTCLNCHPSGAYTTGHLSGSVQWSLSSSTKYNANSKYKSAKSGATTTVAPSATYGSCATTSCHGQSSPAAWGTTVTSNHQCFKCHGQKTATFTNFSAATVAPGGSGTDTGGNSLATAPRVGAHQTHLTASDGISDKIHCGECHTTHTTLTDATHLNYTTATITFGSLAKTQSHTPSATRTSGIITCNNTYCHTGKLNSGTAMSPSWVNSGYLPATMTIAGCSSCHGFPPASTTGHPAVAAPTSFPTSACSGCHTNVSSTGTTYATIFKNKNLHINGFINVTGGGPSHSYPFPGATHMTATGATTPSTGCSCHNSTTAGTYPVARGTAPACMACHKTGLLRTVATSSCYDCHGPSATSGQPNGAVGAFPNYSGSHTTHINQGLTCVNCHNGYGTGSTKHGFSNTSTSTQGKVAFSGLTKTPTWTPATSTCSAACHVQAVWGTHLGCINCHSATITRTKGRVGATLAAITTEFGLAWGHKKTGRGAVTDDDCIVCHLEGNGSTHRPSTYHGDGNIDLRDPDGAGETPITNMSNAAWNFQRFSTSYAAGSRTSTGHTANTVDNIITQKFCLKCHDGNGATNPTARAGTAPTQYLPFGTGSQNTAATYPTPSISAGVAGGVVNVFRQFSTGNASYHPVRAPLNRDFPASTRLNAPYNNTTRTGVSGTKVLGVVINCFDCHNQYAVLTTRTIVAHGNAVTLRAPVRQSGNSATTNLCLNCHAAPGTSTGYLKSGAHGTGSAFGTGSTNMNTNTMTNCYYCHGTASVGATVTGSTQQRPIRGVEVHGFNDRTQGVTGSTWTTTGSRPYGFIRNSLSAWAPASSATQTLTNPHTCTGTGGTCNNNMSTSSFTPGGAY